MSSNIAQSRQQEPHNKIPLHSTIAYATGDVGSTIRWMRVGTFLIIFYT